MILLFLLENKVGITEKFKRLIDNLRTNDDEIISIRCKRITKRINLDFWNSTSETQHIRYLGSYGRGTDIREHSDVDLAVLLPGTVYSQYNLYMFNGQSALLQTVKKSIKTTYPLTEIGGDGQVVVVQFGDGIKFEVVPVFQNTDGSFTYADSNNGGSWKKNNPIAEISAINYANTLYNKKVKHLARMARAWKQTNNVPIKGLLIDTFAYNFMSQWEYNDKSFLYYDYMIRDFMKFLSQRDKAQQYWQAPGSYERVSRIGLFEYKAAQAYTNALEAISYENNGKLYSANLKWKEIFGRFFIN
ncbi:SMODS domain-containing nucleotidyltransferase [Nostoc flagelliforme]|uniref:SMODS domain-containing nucleotidyltransferase n=1 Tax=Nostoc flagelliforme TaxID=1306274 RepID=UPI0018F0545B|nr:nucleotidyltransferase domain-containing protein [Nostoc flagelliforme]